MDVSLFLTLSTLFFAATPVSVGEDPKTIWQNNKESGIHLTLHQVHPLRSSSDLLARDEARVKFINYRRLVHKLKANTTSTTAEKLSVHHKAKAHRRSNSSSKTGGGGASMGLKAGTSIGSGNYYVKMGLGTPVNYYDMLVDTGSSLTWLQCKPCEVHCHSQAGPVYNPSSSSTYKYVSCNAPQCLKLEAATLNAPLCSSQSNRCLYEASYGDQSYSFGYLSRDTLTLASTGKQTFPEFVYGCGEDTQGLFGRSAGLIGFARNSLSMSAQLATKYGFIFSYCLPTKSDGNSSKVGTLSIGSRSSLYYSRENGAVANKAVQYAFTPMISNPENPSLYFLRWTGMTVSGKPLKRVASSKYRSTSTVIDSGTVISRIPVTIYEALRDAFVEVMSSRYPKAPPYSILDTCYYNKPKKSANHQQEGEMKVMLVGVPAVSMIFQGGAELKLEPQNIVMEVEKEGKSCLAFAATDGIAIIGNNQQQMFRIVYDVTNSKIGFAAGDCD